MMRSIVALLLALCGSIVNAMPMAEEIAAAEPLVQEVMKAEMDALRSGKKTREQVGDAAVALAKAAQAPAEKYILLTGAFGYYMRDGAYDKAASALEAVRKVVPDWKGSDEFALIEKAMRSVAFGKGGPVRERYEELKERQQYALRLRKALEQAKAKPSDKKLQFQVAAYYAALDRWPQALDAFIAGSSPACVAAAKLEKESAPPAKIADAWWSALDVKPDFLSSAIRAHAAALYTKALADPTFAGLPRVAAEKRIAEAESAATELISDPRATSYGNKKNPYATKGLVAMWDGEWNVALGKHGNNANKWNDVVGKSHCDPVGVPKFSSKATVLDGNSCWKINPTPELLKTVASGDLTVEVVLSYAAGAVVGNEGFISFGKSDSRVLWGYAGRPPALSGASIVLQHKGATLHVGGAAEKFEGLHVIALSVANNEMKAWIDAKSIGASRSGNVVNAEPCYLGWILGFSKMVGNIYSVRIYDRPLSLGELQANQAVDLKRFTGK